MDEKIVLRDAPGVADIERRLEDLDNNRLMRPEIDELSRDIDRLSLQLFGITGGQTDYVALPDDHRPFYEDEWEKHFEFIDQYAYDEEDAFWAAFNLDVSHADGGPLLCLDVFGRQLVCALRQLHPSAGLLFVTGPETAAQADAAAEAWGRRLMGRE